MIPLHKCMRFALYLGLCSPRVIQSAPVLSLPARPENAVAGKKFLARITSLGLRERENEIRKEILSGNVPDFLRHLCPVEVTNVFEGKTNRATFFVTPDYLAVGSQDDYFLAPMKPQTAQMLADALNCSLPTPKMVDAIYRAAAVKLAPSPIPPSPAMTTVPVFSNHNFVVRQQRDAQLKEHELGALVAGHKKDVVISCRLTNSPGKVAIYGWHQTNGKPIQPLYLGHVWGWVDYSQCIRLVHEEVIVNNQITTLSKALADPGLGLFSDEGPFLAPRYPTNYPRGDKD